MISSVVHEIVSRDRWGRRGRGSQKSAVDDAAAGAADAGLRILRGHAADDERIYVNKQNRYETCRPCALTRVV